MRRILALATLVALIGAACSSIDSETDDASTTTEAVAATTDAGPSGPTVNFALGGTKLASTDQRSLVGAFGNTIALNIADGVVVVDPEPEPQTELWLSAPRWRIATFGGNECAVANGQIIISDTAADDLGLTALSDSLGTIAGQSMVLAAVSPGTELEVISQAIVVQGGLASFHYPVLAQPRWRYGPGSAVVAIPNSSQVTDAIVPTEGDVYVIDYFASEVPRDIDEEIVKYAELFEVEFDEDEITEFSDGLTEANTAIAGHGEFIVGILDRLGVAWESKHIGLAGDRVSDEKAIADALILNLDIAITNLSMGIEPCNVTLVIDGEAVTDPIIMPPLGIAAAMAQRAAKFSSADPPIDSYLVAAAGNHGEPLTTADCASPWFPARFAAGMPAWESFVAGLDAVGNSLSLDADIGVLEDSTVSVGAAVVPDPAGGSTSRATFSACDNGGVTVFAPGTNIISDYQAELGVWSGTSFAAPQIAGAIALDLYDPTP